MKHTFLLFLITFLLNLNAQSQKNKFGVDLSEIRKNKNHLELDVKSIFNGLNSTSLLYKHTFQSGDLIDVNSIQLFRVIATIDSRTPFNDVVIPDFPLNTIYNNYEASSSINLSLGLGLEKQFMRKIMTHYFGIDLVTSYNKFDYLYRSYSYLNQSIDIYEVRKKSEINIGVNPFFGVKFYFSEFFNLGIETGINVAYYIQRSKNIIYEVDRSVFNINTIKSLEGEPFKYNGLKTYFNNLRFLNIGYTF